MYRKVTLSFILIVLLSFGLLQPAYGANFPTRLIEIIVPAGAGGGSDAMARAIGQELSTVFGVTVNVLNIPGGNEAIGLAEFMSRDPDGYTLMTTTTTHIIEAAMGNRPYFDRVEGIALLHQDIYGIHARGGGRFSTIDDVIEAARANPGALTIGGQYALMLDEIVVRRLEQTIGIELNYIPYDSAGQFLADLLGGHIDLIVEEYSVIPDVLESGDVIPLLTLAETRFPLFPDVPTSVERGWDVTDGLIRGLLIASDTPDEIKAIWEDAIWRAFNSENYQRFSASRMLNLRDAFRNARGYNELMYNSIDIYKAIIESVQ